MSHYEIFSLLLTSFVLLIAPEMFWWNFFIVPRAPADVRHPSFMQWTVFKGAPGQSVQLPHAKSHWLSAVVQS